MQNNIVWDVMRFGINIDTAANITLDGNFVALVRSRHLLSDTLGDTQCAFVGCGKTPGQYCLDIKMTNNIAAGVEPGGVDTTGYTIMANDCGDSKTVIFKDNIAHSIGGNGAIIFKNSSSWAQGKCLEASYFTAYKCTGVGIVSNQHTDGVTFTNMILIDNGYGASADVGKEGLDQYARMKNMVFYGETEARDCEFAGFC